MLIVQISDSHVTPTGEGTGYSDDPGVNLARCVAVLKQMVPGPDAVIMSGDLVNSGDEGEYERLRDLLSPLTMPIYVIPGNHDARTPLRTVFHHHSYLPREGVLRYCIDAHALRLIALDTVMEGSDAGTLDDAQLAWLGRELSRTSERRALIFMHHPPVRTGIHCIDEIALEARSARMLGEIIGRHPCVERIVCGHAHRPSHVRWCGTTVSVCPSMAFQMAFDLQSNAPFVASSEPPAYQLHYWNGEHLVTHTLSI